MRPSKVISITGIPYDQTEEQVLDIASSVGPVVSSKLLFDRETGKSKGICLVEYQDYETASSAVRNLNNYTLGNEGGSVNGKGNVGSRYLKCNFASEDSIHRLLQGDGWSGGGGFRSSPEEMSRYELENEIPPLPAGVNVMDSSMDGLNAVIYQALTNMDTRRLRNLVKDAKIMSLDNGELMQVLLDRNPQLIYALVQSAMLLNIANPEVIKGLLIEGETVPEGKVEVVEDKVEGVDLGMTQEQMDAIRAICQMTDEQISEQIGDKDQQRLYREIREKYGGSFN
ncbi:DEKNAAC102119 [Brettanomyces naardenensis]|uniref:DEKNAAC102119 n=1 Tax=Brettanomyces naardenensis TaxID=13370 RepID=A0A448YJS0_BRENA|nr:DEKNAAC102119 [Brettanomyces naardenensis]